VATSLLKSEGGADGAASAEVANQASVALTSALDAASAGVNTAAAKSFLGAASSVGDSLTADSSSSSQAQGARAAQLRVLLSKLGSALLQQVPTGATSTVSTVENGKGTAIAVAKQDSTTAAANGLDAGGIQGEGYKSAPPLQHNPLTTWAVTPSRICSRAWGRMRMSPEQRPQQPWNSSNVTTFWSIPIGIHPLHSHCH